MDYHRPSIPSGKKLNLYHQHAFVGALKVFNIPASGEHDLLQFMTDTKPQIDQLVSENVNKTGRKLQLVLKAELLKPIKEEAIEVFLRSAMTPVYGTSLPQPDFLNAVDKMTNTLFTFTASGSGWIMDRIVELEVRFATFNPIRGSSYLPTPPELDASRLLLNIRNRQDHNCFLYCFTAAWHLKYGPLLFVASRDSSAKRTSPDTYSNRNQLAHQKFPKSSQTTCCSAVTRGRVVSSWGGGICTF